MQIPSAAGCGDGMLDRPREAGLKNARPGRYIDEYFTEQP
jgi:hypothetical protein